MTDAGSAAVPETPQAIEGFKALGFFAADHAAEESGKVYVNGGYWSVLRFPAFPAVLPACSIVAVIQLPFHSTQKDHGFRIDLEGSDGEKLPLQIEGGFRAAPGLDSRYGEPGVIPVAVPIHGLGFDRPGDYSFVLIVNEQELARYSFRVIQVAFPGIPMSIHSGGGNG